MAALKLNGKRALFTDMDFNINAKKMATIVSFGAHNRIVLR